MDLDQIRIKLSHQVNPPRGEDISLPADWPKTSLPRSGQGHGSTKADLASSQRLSKTLATLQKRASGSPTDSEPQPVSQVASTVSELEVAAQKEAEIHLRRLRAIAEKINILSAEQEHLMGDMKSVESRLSQLRHYLGPAESDRETLPRVNLEDAVLAWAESETGREFWVTYRTANLPHPEQDAQDIANHLRGAYGPETPNARHQLWTSLGADFGEVWQEPAALLQYAVQSLKRWGQNLRALISSQQVGGASSPTLPPSSWGSLSLVDMLLWFGGGVIGRLALNLILSAVPALWSLAVAALTGVTAYALYRATLAPRRDFGLAYRTFLIIAGLVIGGRF